MRIIAGLYKGKKLKAPLKLEFRPSHDRLKETLFNLINHHYKDYLLKQCVLDVFAGSGAIGIEAISRGASNVTFVEQEPSTVKLLKYNIPKAVISTTNVINQDFLTTKPKQFAHKYSLVYLDPPYNQNLMVASLQHLLSLNILTSTALIIAETSVKTDLTKENNNLLPLKLNSTKIIGKSQLYFFTYLAV